jgi:aminoglycoside phosphotransferase (APT) family kinase protein
LIIDSQKLPAPPSGSATLDDHRELLDRLGLAGERVISADGDSFVTLRCRDAVGRPLVLKRTRTGCRDTIRRLTNEALLCRDLPVGGPLRLLKYRDHGTGYLLTEFDEGRLLLPEQLDDEATIRAIVGALTRFQRIRLDLRRIGVVDREHPATYYLKVLLKHILHLWPAYISARDAARAVTIVTAALPAILRQRVICHGDFLPTNLLYHREDGSITLTDLEGFMTANHPLFDVVALFTMNDYDLTQWSWQRKFFRRYLDLASMSGLDPRSDAFVEAYRGILVFFLVYRLNEGRIALLDTAYFDGLGKQQYLKRKIKRLASGHHSVRRDPEIAEALETRTRNLQRVLSRRHFREHLRFLQEPVNG